MADFKAPGQHTYKGVQMPAGYLADILDRVPDFEFRPDDVLVSAYPKSGTTWLQQIVSLIKSDDIIETSRKQPIGGRAPMLELKMRETPANIDTLIEMKSARIIKTHLHYSFYKESIEAPEKPKFKTIVGMRNVRDTLVSYYHFYKMNGRTKFAGDFAAFFELFKAKGLVVGDYFDNVLSWWEVRDNPNIHVVKYEDMKKDLRGEIKKIASFLDKTLTDTQLDTIVQESTFESMEANPMTNFTNNSTYKMSVCKFMRKGQVGDWQNFYTEEQVEYLNSRCEKELAPHGLEFEYI